MRDPIDAAILVICLLLGVLWFIGVIEFSKCEDGTDNCHPIPYKVYSDK